MRGPKLIILGREDPDEGGEWKDRLIGEGTLLGELYRIYVSKKGWCPRCKKKTQPKGDGKYFCKNCGAIYPDEELIASDNEGD